MRYVAAYMLAALGSKGEPTAADVEKILGSVGVEVEADKVNKVVNELKGKQLEELIEEGEQKNQILVVPFLKAEGSVVIEPSHLQQAV